MIGSGTATVQVHYSQLVEPSAARLGLPLTAAGVSCSVSDVDLTGGGHSRTGEEQTVVGESRIKAASKMTWRNCSRFNILIT